MNTFGTWDEGKCLLPGRQCHSLLLSYSEFYGIFFVYFPMRTSELA